uniref:Uncharacterized protein n=1 Tax=Lactuca sativa TaxID=4236 RepID=A0A9R1X7W1_LACSA|nr:hypothetical protein LSAT_V11C500229790 [Lactuca sativa]
MDSPSRQLNRFQVSNQVLQISSSSDNNDSDEDLILYTLLSAARDMERDENSNVEKKHRKWINRDRRAAHELLVCDYVVVDYLYDLSKFEERFPRDLTHNYEFFQLRWDARGKRGFATIQKCTTALT